MMQEFPRATSAPAGYAESAVEPLWMDDEQSRELSELLASLSQKRSRAELSAWFRSELVQLLPHGSFVCCLSKLDGDQSVPIETIAHDFPLERLQAEFLKPGSIHARIMRHWLKSGSPVLANPDEVGRVIDNPEEQRAFHAERLENIAAFGMHDFTRVYVSHLSFHRICEPLNEKHRRLLELLVPPLHAAMVRVAHASSARSPAGMADCKLTQREMEVLGWIRLGKTNSEIAAILGTSYSTVKNQVQNILLKLRVNNRTQAVAKVINAGFGHSLAK